MLLIGQHEQLDSLRAAYRRCRERRGHVMLVAGAVGSGKTALLDAFCDEVNAEGGTVLSAAGSRAERNVRFGVVGQLLHHARLSGAQAERVDTLTRDPSFSGHLAEPGTTLAEPRPSGLGAAAGTAAPAAATPAGHPPVSREQAQATVLHGLLDVLLELADSGPLVLAVDDVHHADLASLHCLLYVARRLRSAPVMLVLTEAAQMQPVHPAFRAELLSLPYFSRQALYPLCREAVEKLAAEGGDLHAPEFVDACVAVTGGNQLLLRALLDEQVDEDEAADPTEPRPGGLFDQAVHGCLYRLEPAARQAARALAVLGRPSRMDLLSEMLEAVPEAVTQAMRVLRATGLADADQLRHPRVRASVLGDLLPEEHRTLHRRAAIVLHEHGAPPPAVAEHLVASAWIEAPWAATLLHEAAAHALSAGRPDVAGTCLRLAQHGEVDDRQRTAAAAMLVRAHWQVNPLTVNGRLTELVKSAQGASGCMDDVLSAVPYLLWEGRVEEAVEALRPLTDDAAAAVDPEAPARLATTRLLVSLSHPDQLPTVRETPAMSLRTGALAAIATPALQVMSVLATALTAEPDGDPATAAEQILQRHGAEGAGMLAAPLLAMLYGGRASRVAAWADDVLGRPATRQTPIWSAIVHAIRAEAALRLGALPAAQRHAEQAVAEIPLSAWGVAVGGPLATLIMSAIESGRLADAERWLAEPVPQRMFRTPFGLHYLHARGRYQLAAGRPQAALADLRTCGELMQRWGIDVSTVVPWRLELARVQLRLGNKPEAATLLQDQIRGEASIDDRTRGTALRLFAATAPMQMRGAYLSQSVNLLQGCGDRVELARALGDTGQVLRGVGDGVRARLLVRRAYQLAQEAGAHLLAERLLRREPGIGLGAPPTVNAGEPEDGLSEAERRVAVLAAQGFTNRQISTKLYITVSTVEQHLTRVYRKLAVKRRTDLPARLVADTPVVLEPVAS